MIDEVELRCPVTTDLGLVRDLIRIHAERSGLPGHRLDDLVLAVNEAVTNVLDHGAGRGTITARRTGSRIVVEILDAAGRLTRDHLAAAEIDPAKAGGFGLWVIQHLCDDVSLEQTELGSLLSLRVGHRPRAPHRPHHRGGRDEHRLQPAG